jgi:hypothetical protein
MHTVYSIKFKIKKLIILNSYLAIVLCLLLSCGNADNNNTSGDYSSVEYSVSETDSSYTLINADNKSSANSINSSSFDSFSLYEIANITESSDNTEHFSSPATINAKETSQGQVLTDSYEALHSELHCLREPYDYYNDSTLTFDEFSAIAGIIPKAFMYSGVYYETSYDRVIPYSSELWGDTIFVPAFDRYERMKLTLFLFKDNEIVYVFPNGVVSTWHLQLLGDVKFVDINGDDKEDIIIIAYCDAGTGGIGAVAQAIATVFFSTKNGFAAYYDIEDLLNNSPDIGILEEFYDEADVVKGRYQVHYITADDVEEFLRKQNLDWSKITIPF